MPFTSRHPPAFDEAQADWYLRPDLTEGIEEPMLLKEAIVSHPIPHKLVDEAIVHHAKRLKWNAGKTNSIYPESHRKARFRRINVRNILEIYSPVFYCLVPMPNLIVKRL